MKRFLAFLLAVCLLGALTACGGQTAPGGEAAPSETEDTRPQTPPAAPETSPDAVPSPDEPEETADGVKTLVAYFSATGSTRAAAERIAELTGADVYEIVPAQPYTAEDLDYNVSDSRANREMNDASARPAIGSGSIDISGYDTVIIGYPIWWGQAPKIMYTFLESYDLTGKTIIPFCTSGSSGIDGSLAGMQALAPDADWLTGQRFAGGGELSAVESWVNSLELPVQ